MKQMTKNWKTTLAGIVTFLVSVPSFVAAVQAASHHQNVDWLNVLGSVAMASISAGLLAAKDGTTHSTLAQVEASTVTQDAEAAHVAIAKPPVAVDPNAPPK